MCVCECECVCVCAYTVRIKSNQFSPKRNIRLILTKVDMP